jgi:uncharacterized protein (TIGR00255 family)
MIRSMTGFGRGEASDGARTASVEIRSVNHRYGEISVKLPRRYAFAEDAVKRAARMGISRGKTDISVSITSVAEEDVSVAVNEAAAKQYFRCLRDLQKSFDVSGDISLELLAGMPDVFMPAAGGIDEESALAVILDAAEAALSDMNRMREAEGGGLAADMTARAEKIEALVCLIEEKSEGLPAAYAEKLNVRITELLEKSAVAGLTEDRIALEAAVFADKSDVTEEVVRLRSHTAQLKAMLAADGGAGSGAGVGVGAGAGSSASAKAGADGGADAVGKKLDFLVQEMNREANTIGSKANDIEITKIMLDIKSEVEKIREQVQNIE